MARLCEATQGFAEREAEVELWSAIGSGGICTLYGNYSARLKMVCQRCLRWANIEIEGSLDLAMVSSEAEATRIGGEYEIYQLGKDNMFSTREVIEQELLLSLPYIPMHENDADCDAAMLRILKRNRSEQSSRPENSPFAILKNLNRD
ncbi:MAG: DUF177 domain-containing protein [Pseudomonadota bacterium]